MQPHTADVQLGGDIKLEIIPQNLLSFGKCERCSSPLFAADYFWLSGAGDWACAVVCVRVCVRVCVYIYMYMCVLLSVLSTRLCFDN